MTSHVEEVCRAGTGTETQSSTAEFLAQGKEQKTRPATLTVAQVMCETSQTLCNFECVESFEVNESAVLSFSVLVQIQPKSFLASFCLFSHC